MIWMEKCSRVVTKSNDIRKKKRDAISCSSAHGSSSTIVVSSIDPASSVGIEDICISL